MLAGWALVVAYVDFRQCMLGPMTEGTHAVSRESEVIPMVIATGWPMSYRRGRHSPGPGLPEPRISVIVSQGSNLLEIRGPVWNHGI